ncbi:MAG: hypothetical protein COV30_02340 [Candidatus Yanofskybacteria bacterium CG10_big_fil_rev_8_21_14_0_10_37_15]|uniref:Uncharacterized protein n=1 Tax=Candidatus Yanofskybacteria bacterium CG10_big_fil_rev_8_21_14_0_10_37_15 TaxID=1975097 RepID=A0A2H0R5E7_9BACT|nr:MAG: hypothetical protein COV30_02340 [Candidatus Yanofskybacteria bacterium CG10_big_fil_rev_8_21_14_0_10_37_15]
MSNQFWTNFFRKDLNLGNRWWHRLFLVIFFFSFAWSLYMMSNDLFADNHPYVPQWKIVDSVDERLTSEVKQIRDLKKIGEKVEEKGRSYVLNPATDMSSLYDDFYCSTDIKNKISEIQGRSGIANLYLNRKSVSVETFTDYVRNNDIKCLIPDAYTSYGTNGKIDGKVSFLEPLGPNTLYGKDLVFYEKSNLFTAFYVSKMFLLTVAVFAGIAIAYYKIFLYVIFGKRKENI